MNQIHPGILNIPIDQNVLKELQDAIQSLFFSQGVGPEGIAKANTFLEQFKADSSSLVYAFEFIQSKHNDVIRSYGFHVLTAFLKSNWEFMHQDLKTILVSRIFQYMKSGTKGILNEASFVKEKIGVLFSEIAKREWPQRMPSLVDELTSLIYMDMDSCIIALACLRTFILDVSPEFSNDMDLGRKREIIRNLQKMMTLDFFGRLIEIFSRIHEQYSSALEQRNSVQFNTSKLVMNEMLSLIQALMVEWVPTNLLFAKKIPLQVCRYLGNDDFREKAVETLVAVTHLPWKITEFDLLSEFILQFCECTNNIMKSKGLLDEEYEFNKSLCMALEGILNVNFSRVMNKKKDAKKPILRLGAKNLSAVTELVKMLVNFLEHPAFHFSEILIPAWKNVLQANSPIAQQFFFKLECPRIFEACFLKLHKEIGNPDNIDIFVDSKVTTFSVMEWEDGKDFKPSQDDIIQSIKEIIHVLVNVDHKISMDYIEHLCKKLSSCNKPNPSVDQLDPTTGVITMKSMTYLRWDAASRLIECMMTSIDLKSDSDLTACLPRLVEIFGNMIRLEITDPLLAGRYMDLMKSFFHLYDQNRDALGAILERIVTTARYRNNKETDLSPLELSPDTVRLRKKALVTLIYICNKIPKRIINFLDHFLSLAEKMWSTKEISGSELVLLYEALIIVSNYIPVKGKKQAFLKYLLLTPKQDIVTDQVIAVCGDLEQMLKMFDLLPEPDVNKKTALKNLFDKLRFALHLFVSAGDSIEQQSEGENEIGVMLFDILKPVHSLTRSLHRFKTPEVFERLPPDSQKTLSVGHLKGELATQLGMDNTNIVSEQQKEQRKIRKNIHSMLNACYKIFGLVCQYSVKDNFYRNSGLINLLTSSIFFNFSRLQSDNLQQILKFFVTPFVENCPPDLIEVIAIPALINVFQQVSSHLEVGWIASLARKNGETESKFTIEEEIVLDSMLIALDSEIMRIPLTLTNNLTPGGKTRLSELSKAVLHSKELMLTILSLCFNLLSVPDTTAASKAVVFIGRILPQCAPDSNYEEILAKDINMALLRALTTVKYGEKHNIIQVIADIFSWYRKLNSNYLTLVYQQLPDVTEAKWNQLLDNYERTIRQKNGDKKFRKIITEFLQPIMDSKSSTMRPKIGKISFQEQPKNTNNAAVMNVNTLFQ